MERKHLIRPVTIEKVKVFMKAVSAKIQRNETFSLDVLARSHSISGSTGTAMIRNNWIKLTDVKHQYDFNEDPYLVNDTNAKLLIEQVRLQNYKKSNDNQKPFPSGGISPRNHIVSENQEETEEMVVFKQKSLKTSDFAPILEKIFSKINEGKQGGLFDEVNNIRNERINVASFISSGVWSGAYFRDMSEQSIQEVNRMVVFATDDLLDQLKSTLKK